MEIEEFHNILNTMEVIPDKGYRRDNPVYELVSYVNNVIACVLSSNLKVAHLFMERAEIYIEENPPTLDAKEYYGLITNYFKSVKKL